MNDSQATREIRVIVFRTDSSGSTELPELIRNGGYEVAVATNETELRAELVEAAIVVLDDGPGRSPLRDVVRLVLTARPGAHVIAVSRDLTTLQAHALVREGAFWVFRGEVQGEEILLLLAKAAISLELSERNRILESSVGSVVTSAEIVGSSEAVSSLRARMQRVAPLDETVLLTGESGTGKTLLARTIHASSMRSKRPFVSISCAAIPRDLVEAELFGHEKGAFTGAAHARAGSFEVADGGTLFLDEVGDLPLEVQPKLLTVLQDRSVRRLGSNTSRRVDVRIIAATSLDLDEMCERGVFRKDLFYRLNVLAIIVPPLRERGSDIDLLADHILERIRQKRGRKSRFVLDEGAREALRSHRWPGNIRELENTLERATAFSDGDTLTRQALGLGDAAQGVPDISLLGYTLDEIEERLFAETLEATGYDKTETASRLGVSLKTVYNRIAKYGLARKS